MKTPLSNNLENDCSPPADAEVRATAWALGQLDDTDRAAFEAEMADDPALAAYAREMRSFCLEISLELPEETDQTQLVLVDRQRTPLLAALARNQPADGKIVRGNFATRHWLGLLSVSVTAAAACVMVSMRPAWMTGQGTVSEPLPHFARGGSAPLPASKQQPMLTPAQQLSDQKITNLKDSDGLVLVASTDGSTASEALLPPPAAAAPPTPDAVTWTSQPGAIRTYSESESAGRNPVYKLSAGAKAKTPTVSAGDQIAVAEPMAASDSRGRGAAAGYGGSYPAASAPAGPVVNTEGFQYSRQRSILPEKISDLAAASAPRPEAKLTETDGYKNMAEFETRPTAESYQRLPSNPFMDVTQAPLSTFSIDVDTASYANVRRFLNAGSRPPAEAVRLEELVNYFPYDEPGPVDGKPFAVRVDVTSAPWDAKHRLARVVLKGKEIAAAERPASNLVFLVDVSGSMNEPNKLPLVQQSLRLLAERLTENDCVTLVTYAGNSQLVLPPTNGQNKQRILGAIDSLTSGGGTNGAGGIAQAYQQAAAGFVQGGVNRVILATDGDFNVGVTSHDDLLSLISEKAKTGVFLSVLGYGMGNLKDDTMELLADKGNGNYAYIDSLSEARKSLVEQMSGTLVTIAKDVKIQIEFNPAIVKSYKLLGYENRLLAKEDFNNDKKDAGEIGAGHTVTALYEIVPAGQPDVPVKTEVDGLKYQQAPVVIAPKPEPTPAATGSGEMMNVKLRWKQPQADTSELMEVPVKDSGSSIDQASNETRWAAAVAGFARLLRGDAVTTDTLTWEAIRQLARSAKGPDPLGYRGEFLQLLGKAESVSR